jgi:protoporphyrinogen oxidase
MTDGAQAPGRRADLLHALSRDSRATGDVGVAVLGAGPAGLTAAHVLGLRGLRGTVFEADGQVGGLAKTVQLDGYRFDLGGHRFFTKMPEIDEFWESLLGSDFLVRPRLSRIYYNGKFFSYPLKAKDVPTRLGVRESFLCLGSYLRSRRNGKAEPETFEDWVSSRFGRRLYDVFFRSYTEKIWGIPGSEIRSEWAAQRIRDFSLPKAMLSLAGVRRNMVTLIEEFRYPRLGPGQVWEALADQVEGQGIPIHLNSRCVGVCHDGGSIESVVVESGGTSTEHDVDALLSTMPLADLVASLVPAPPAEVLEAAGRLRYRAMCVVALMTEQAEPFPDNWIYLHDPGTRAGRVQNFGAWSPEMVRPGTTCLGVEYFCHEGDDIWELSEEDAVALATEELSRIGLLDRTQVVQGARVRVPRAYPVYDGEYRDAVRVIRDYLAGIANFQTFGRNGLHRYNNQDHSMLTAALAVANLVDGADNDVWEANADRSYLEEGHQIHSILGLNGRVAAPPPQDEEAGEPEMGAAVSSLS